jgi:hypothetical protein
MKIFIVFLSYLLAAPSAFASYTYSYVGNELSGTTNSYITFQVTLPELLTPNTSAQLSPLCFSADWSMSLIGGTEWAGPETVTLSSSNSSLNYGFTTDSRGQIVDWMISAERGSVVDPDSSSIVSMGVMLSISYLPQYGGLYPGRDYVWLSPLDTFGGLSLSAGSWIQPSWPVPVPGSYAMMLAGLSLVGAITQRRKAAPEGRRLC